MARQPVVQGESGDEERRRDDVLRPRRLKEVIGQQSVVKRLEVAINAAKKLKELGGKAKDLINKETGKQ